MRWVGREESKEWGLVETENRLRIFAFVLATLLSILLTYKTLIPKELNKRLPAYCNISIMKNVEAGSYVNCHEHVVVLLF